jgi:diguanylate cyclase (GGDEF)-like protein
MALPQDAFIGIFAAILAADLLVIVAALVWSRVQSGDGNRPRPGASAATAARRPGGATATNGGNGHGGNGGTNGAPGMAPMSIGGRVGAMPPAMAVNIVPAIDPTTDDLTGLLLPSAWSRIVADEEARIRRYHRPATIVVIELEGLDKLAERMGPGSIERIVPAVADTLRRGAREADHIARLGAGRFAVLMPETDEVVAINYVERVRRACELWLEAGAVALHLAMGWASSSGDGTLADAETVATDRMFAELRRAARVSTPPTEPTVGNGGMEPALGS